MLKIRDDKVKGLKRFGFKPKYDEDTGEVEKYIITKNIRTSLNTDRSIIIAEIRKSMILRGQYDYIELWEIKDIDSEILYDLIQAGLVEKVEE